MNRTIKITQISSLEKHYAGKTEYTPLQKQITLVKGETFHWIEMLELDCEERFIKASIEKQGTLAPYVKLFQMRDIPADYPKYPDADDDYLFDKPGLVSDWLNPMEDRNFIRLSGSQPVFVWGDIVLPEDIEAGTYTIALKYVTIPRVDYQDIVAFDSPEITLTVLDAELPKQELIYTQWFHVDCIAEIHQVPIYSEAHWNFIDSYMKLAAEHGMNMLLTPVITPPLDTEVGFYRPNTQLVDIVKEEDTYHFTFEKLDRYIQMALDNGFRYFEIAHLFSQWDMLYTPAVYATVNGEYKRIFGWDASSTGEPYRLFLTQFIPALKEELSRLGVLDACFFHISDEPKLPLIERYRALKEIVAPLLGDVRMMDALSDLDFYKEGLVQTPVTSINHIAPFLISPIEHQWAYYCCGQYLNVSNRFLAMPSARTRAIGLQLYLYDIEGFLQWGYNFYHSCRSNDLLNPYCTTSGDFSYPSGDPFTVYPGLKGAEPSVRQKVFQEGLQDLRLCKLAEQKLGKAAVKKLINDAAVASCGKEITFDEYPRTIRFYEEMNRTLKNLL